MLKVIFKFFYEKIFNVFDEVLIELFKVEVK